MKRVVPGTDAQRTARCKQKPKVSMREAACAIYNWAAVAFIFAMVFSQLLDIVWNTIETDLRTREGADPTLGPRALAGSMAKPFADRVVACVKEEWSYKPVLVSDLLASGSTQVVDTTGAAVNGYRLIERSDQQRQYPALDVYMDLCAMISTTIDTIFVACDALGYSATQDMLRVLDGVDSSTMVAIPDALPVVLVPLSDNPMDLSFMIPGVDGSACAFRLSGKYLDKAATTGVLRGITRSTRESRTAEWIGRAGGTWRNGWYEDTRGEKWHADMISSDQQSPYAIPLRQFDTLQWKELDCVHTEACREPSVVESWGSKSSTTLQLVRSTSVSISNGKGRGIFFREQLHHRSIQVVYDWETLISNISLMTLVARWVFAMFALQNGYLQGKSAWYNAGIGCLASSRSFNMLFIVLLPRLRVTLSAFWSVGCEFDGPQRALSESWFVIYPAIVEIMLLEFSVLNIFAKILRRRIPDAPFGPSVLFLCGLHWLRTSLADSGSFLGIDGKLGPPPLVSSAEFENLSLAALFTTDVAFRLNGNLTSLVAIKLVLVSINFLPLLLAKSPVKGRSGTSSNNDVELLGVEKALAIQWWKIGGLGGTRDDCKASSKPDDSLDGRVISSYELVRLGYLVYGGTFLISFDDWRGLVVAAPFRRFYHLWNNRVTLFRLCNDRDAGDAKLVHERPHMRRLDDPELEELRWWKIVGRPVK